MLIKQLLKTIVHGKYLDFKGGAAALPVRRNASPDAVLRLHCGKTSTRPHTHNPNLHPHTTCWPPVRRRGFGLRATQVETLLEETVRSWLVRSQHPQRPKSFRGAGRIRTGVDGFATRWIAALPRRLSTKNLGKSAGLVKRNG